MQTRCALCGLLLLAVFTLAASARTATLTATNNDSGVGSLRQTILNASSADTIIFAPGLSGATILLTSGELLLNNNLNIDGSALTNGITLNGNGSNSVFDVAGGTTNVLTALTITNGSAPGFYGGGVINFGVLTVNRCTVTGNSAYLGGGLFNYSAGTLTVNQCTVTGNVASDSGGGILNYTGTLNVNQSTVTTNSASGTTFSGGGGINTYSATMTLTNTIVAGNSASTATNIYILGSFLNPVVAMAGYLVNLQVTTTGGGRLDAWVDFNLDGDWNDANEQIFTNRTLGNGVNNLSFTVPVGVVAGTSYARFRLSTAGGLAPTGAAADGEVEDYRVTILPASPPTALVVDAAQDGSDGDLSPGYLSLREAVQIANVNPALATITFAPALAGTTINLSTIGDGTYGPSALLVNSAIVIDGSAAPGLTIARDGAAPNMRLFYIAPAGNLMLRNLTLSGGVAQGGNGGYNEDGGAGGGAGGFGGAIYNRGALTIESCALQNHQAKGGAGGGGMGGDGGVPINIDPSGGQRKDGAAGGGPNGGGGGTSGPGGNGGIGGGGGGGSISCYGPSGPAGPGGVGGFGGGGGGGSGDPCGEPAGGGAAGGFGAGSGVNGGSSPEREGPGGGGAGMGGVLFNDGGMATLTNSTLSGNAAKGGSGGSNPYQGPAQGGSGLGGVIFNLDGTVSILNSTFNSNSVTPGNGVTPLALGGGVYNRINSGTASLTLKNTIIANSAGGDDAHNDGGTVTGDHNLVRISVGLPGGVVSLTSDPLLGPLQANGGPTLTFAPLPGSPAIDAGAATALTTDQRGLLRPIGPAPDLGAVELQLSLIVATNSDSDPGSLRYVITYSTNSSAITFATNLSGSTILLTNGQLLLNKNLTIDGSALPGGITINGNHINRIFEVAGGVTNVLTSLTLTNGYAAGASYPGGFGGGILNGGTLTVNQCTLVGNSAGYAGGIFNPGTLTVNQSTLTGNSALNAGGGIYNSGGPMTMNQSTLAGNSANTGAGIVNDSGTVSLFNSIVAANSGVDIYNLGPSTFIRVGANIVQSLVNAATDSGPAAINAAPLLAALGNYGGPTMTMALLPGSPARNAAIGSTITSDQRDFPIVGTPDIGAYEAGTVANYNAWIWETLPATATAAQHAATFDFDGDGIVNLAEFAFGLNPTQNNAGQLPQGHIIGANFVSSFTQPADVSGITYGAEWSTTLLPGSWTAISDTGIPPQHSFSVPTSGKPKLFMRLKVTSP